MSQEWPLVRLSQLLQLQRRWVTVDPTATYREIGVRSYGKGIFHKSPVVGASLGNKRVLLIRSGDLVFSNVFAWEGAVAVAREAEEDMIGSHRFVTYTVNLQRSSPEYLKLYFTTGAGLEILRKVSPGSAGRNRTLNLDQFIEYGIPLPALEEQRRIWTKVEQLGAKIKEAKELRQRATDGAEALIRSAITAAIGNFAMDGCLGDVLVERPRNGWSARCDGSEAGIPVLSLAAITGFRYRRDQFKRTSEPVKPGAHYWLRDGDLLISRSNTAELVGHAAIYSGQPSPCIYPDLMMRLEVDERRADKRFVYHLLRSLPARDFVQRNAKGTSPTMKKISQEVVVGVPFPKGLQLEAQRHIVGKLDGLEAKIQELRNYGSPPESVRTPAGRRGK
jgi:type I restriction enzyme S subunit